MIRGRGQTRRRGRSGGDRGGTGLRLSPEDRLLLACGRVDLDPPNRDLVTELLAGRLDWDRLLAKAVSHGLPTLVYHHLRSLDARGEVPGQVWDALERAYRAAHLLAMQRRYEVRRLLDTLRAADLGVIALEGLALTETVFSDPALRPGREIDLLVRLPDINAVETILQRLGYVPDEEYELREWWRPSVAYHLRPRRGPGRRVQVDAHWGLLPPRVGAFVGVDGLWARARLSSVAARPVWMLSPVDLVLHLTLRVAAQHRFRTGLRHLVDVAEACRYYEPQLNQEELVERATRWRARRYAYLALRLARDLLAAPVADEMLEQLRPVAMSENVVTWAQDRLLTARPASTGQPASVKTAGALSPRADENRSPGLLSVLFPSREWMAREHRLPQRSPAVYGYYLLRPFQLLGRYLLTMVGAAHGSRRVRTETEIREQDLLLEEWFETGPGDEDPAGT